jgi:hypothetical protein
MVDDPDIYRAAKLVIDQHGDDAAIRAAERADKLLEDGDIDGALVWRRILAAIEELQPAEAGRNHPGHGGSRRISSSPVRILSVGPLSPRIEARAMSRTF